MDLISTLRHHQRIYLDANVFIYALEGYAAYQDALRSLFSALDGGALVAVTSELTVAELLVKPFQSNQATLQDSYMQILTPRLGLEVAPVDRDILIAAAQYRAAHSALKLPDAIHLATGHARACTAFVTNDKQLGRLPNSNVILLQNYARA